MLIDENFYDSILMDCQEEEVMENKNINKKKKQNIPKSLEYIWNCLMEGKHKHMLKIIHEDEDIIFEVKYTNKKSPEWNEKDISLFADRDLQYGKKRNKVNYEEESKNRFRSSLTKLCKEGYLICPTSNKKESGSIKHRQYKIKKDVISRLKLNSVKGSKCGKKFPKKLAGNKFNTFFTEYVILYSVFLNVLVCLPLQKKKNVTEPAICNYETGSNTDSLDLHAIASVSESRVLASENSLRFTDNSGLNVGQIHGNSLNYTLDGICNSDSYGIGCSTQQGIINKVCENTNSGLNVGQIHGNSLNYTFDGIDNSDSHGIGCSTQQGIINKVWENTIVAGGESNTDSTSNMTYIVIALNTENSWNAVVSDGIKSDNFLAEQNNVEYFAEAENANTVWKVSEDVKEFNTIEGNNTMMDDSSVSHLISNLPNGNITNNSFESTMNSSMSSNSSDLNLSPLFDEDDIKFSFENEISVNVNNDNTFQEERNFCQTPEFYNTSPRKDYTELVSMQNPFLGSTTNEPLDTSEKIQYPHLFGGDEIDDFMDRFDSIQDLEC